MFFFIKMWVNTKNVLLWIPSTSVYMCLQIFARKRGLFPAKEKLLSIPARMPPCQPKEGLGTSCRKPVLPHPLPHRGNRGGEQENVGKMPQSSRDWKGGYLSPKKCMYKDCHKLAIPKIPHGTGRHKPVVPNPFHKATGGVGNQVKSSVNDYQCVCSCLIHLLAAVTLVQLNFWARKFFQLILHASITNPWNFHVVFHFDQNWTFL